MKRTLPMCCRYSFQFTHMAPEQTLTFPLILWAYLAMVKGGDFRENITRPSHATLTFWSTFLSTGFLSFGCVCWSCLSPFLSLWPSCQEETFFLILYGFVSFLKRLRTNVQVMCVLYIINCLLIKVTKELLWSAMIRITHNVDMCVQCNPENWMYWY